MYRVALSYRPIDEWARQGSNSDLCLDQQSHTELFRQGVPGKTGYLRAGNMQECL